MKVFVMMNGKWYMANTSSELLADMIYDCANLRGLKCNIDRIGNQEGGWYEKLSGRRVYY